MKVSLAKLLKRELEKMSDFGAEQKLMKTHEFSDYDQMFIITKRLSCFQSPQREWRVAPKRMNIGDAISAS